MTQVELAVANHANNNEDQNVLHEDLPASASIEDNNSDYEDIEGSKVEAHMCLAWMQRKLGSSGWPSHVI